MKLVDGHPAPGAKLPIAELATRPGGQAASAMAAVSRLGIEALLAEIDVIITAQDFPAALTGETEPGRALGARAGIPTRGEVVGRR